MILREMWEMSPIFSSGIQGSLGMLMTACPKYFWDLEEKSTVRIRLLGGVLFIVGLCGAIAGYQQQERLATKEDLAVLATRDDIRKAVDSLSGSQSKGVKLNPAKPAAGVASDRGAPPWVSLRAISHKFEVGKPVSIEVSFTNTGDSPARKVKVRAHMEPQFAGSNPNFNLPIPVMDSVGVMAPKGEMRTTITPADGSALEEKGLAFIHDGKMRVFVFGDVEYEDIRGSRHRLEYCYWLAKDASNWVLCGEHNDLN